MPSKDRAMLHSWCLSSPVARRGWALPPWSGMQIKAPYAGHDTITNRIAILLSHYSRLLKHCLLWRVSKRLYQYRVPFVQMDPLGPVASLITIIQAATGIVKLHYDTHPSLYSLNNVPNQLIMITAELEMLQSLKDFLKIHKAEISLSDRQNLYCVIEVLREAITEAQDLCKKYQSQSKRRRRRIKWLVKGDPMWNGIADRLRHAEAHLTLCIAALHLSGSSKPLLNQF